MQVIKPTKKEVFNELRTVGCCWLGGCKCQCYSRQLARCYKDTEERLTKTIQSSEEIKEAQKEHEKLWAEINDMI